jgi:hypothetical protein
VAGWRFLEWNQQKRGASGKRKSCGQNCPWAHAPLIGGYERR